MDKGNKAFLHDADTAWEAHEIAAAARDERYQQAYDYVLDNLSGGDLVEALQEFADWDKMAALLRSGYDLDFAYYAREAVRQYAKEYAEREADNG